MKEEQVTKNILKWLITNNWEIICFDFPQSGTGRILHPNGDNKSKNKDTIIPDIVAIKNGICIFSENKDRFCYSDYIKQNSVKVGGDYSDAIRDLLRNHVINEIFYGIGLPLVKHNNASRLAARLVDFILAVGDDGAVNIVYNPVNIQFLV